MPVSRADSSPDDGEGLSTRDVLRARIAAHGRAPLEGLLERRGLGRYRGYGEVLQAIDALVTRGARLLRAGTSVEGEPLFALELGADGSSGRPRTSVVLSAVHPNEWIGVEAHLALLGRLVDTDLAGRSVVAFPVVNPDGVLRVEANLRAGRRRFVRHNAHGVDLNRNFDASWYRKSLLQVLLPFLYRSGSHPASEPEVAAIATLLSRRRVDRAVSLHAFGGAVLYPPAASRWPVADASEHRAFAEAVARGADRKPYRAVACSRWAFGFTATGLELDWFHDRHGAVSLLVECSRGGFALRPSRMLDPFAWFNPPRIDDVARPIAEALVPFVRGLPPPA